MSPPAQVVHEDSLVADRPRDPVAVEQDGGRVGVLSRQGWIVGPDGHTLTLAGLPPGSHVRWTTLRKARVVFAVRGGLLTLAEAQTRYPELSVEEYASWAHHIDVFGVMGLRTTRTQKYRQGRTSAQDE